MAKDLAVFRLKPQGANTYKMVFGIGKLPKYVSGIQLLLQLVTKQLLATQGSDTFDPTMGAGVRQLLRRPLDQDEVGQIQNDFQVAVSRIEELILFQQSGKALASDERLSSLEVEEVTLNERTLEWSLVIRVVSEAGTGVSVDLTDILVNNGN